MSVGFEVKGNGKPIVLMHGSMASKEQWQNLSKVLCSHYKVITMDLIGYGETSPPEDPESYSLKDESDLLLSLLDEVLDPGASYHLLGHSYGGAVAMHHAYHHSDRVKSLTVIEPMAYHLLPEDHEVLTASRVMIEEIIADIARGESIGAAGKFIDLWMKPGVFANLPDREKQILGEGVKKMVIDFRAAATEPLSCTEYALFTRPVCLIAGKDSPPFSLSISAVIAKTIPHISCHWVDGGHFAPFTHSHQVNPIITEFIGHGDTDT